MVNRVISHTWQKMQIDTLSVFNFATGPEVLFRRRTFNLALFSPSDIKDPKSGQSSTMATDARQRRKANLALMTTRCRCCLLYFQSARSDEVSERGTADVVVALLFVEREVDLRLKDEIIFDRRYYAA
jgi:hypothetical protein